MLNRLRGRLSRRLWRTTHCLLIVVGGVLTGVVEPLQAGKTISIAIAEEIATTTDHTTFDTPPQPLEIRGADNIQAAGEIKGLPKATTSVALTVETKDKAASDALKDATQVAPQERPSVIIVEVLGYGGGAGVEEEEGSKRDQRSDNGAPAYDPKGPVRIVGVGALTEEENQSLRESERKQIGSAP